MTNGGNDRQNKIDRRKRNVEGHRDMYEERERERQAKNCMSISCVITQGEQNTQT